MASLRSRAESRRGSPLTNLIRSAFRLFPYMLHPSLLSSIERPAHIRHADWVGKFVQTCKSYTKSSDAEVVDAVHFSARVQRISGSNADSMQPLEVLRPQLACDADTSNTLMAEDRRPNIPQRVNVLPSAATASPSDSKLQSPYRSSPGSRTSHLRSLRSSAQQQAGGDSSSPSKFFDTNEIGNSSFSEKDSLQAITRLQRYLESDRDGAVLSQLW